MGQKKKKKNKGPLHSRPRAAAKDGSAQLDDCEDAIEEEITALSSIFQDEFVTISGPPNAQFKINISGSSEEMASGDFSVSCTLIVRCTSGYPDKCPKLQVVPENNLSENDADRLLALLLDQANIYAREGRVMIYNLVEAAKEFLSEIAPPSQPLDPVSSIGKNSKDISPTVRESGTCRVRHFIHSSVDLYGDLVGDASWQDSVSALASSGNRADAKSKMEAADKSTKLVMAVNQPSSSVAKLLVKRSIQNQPGSAAMQNITPAELGPNALKDHDSEYGSDNEFELEATERSYDGETHQIEDTIPSEQTRNDDDLSKKNGGSEHSSYASVDNEDAAQKKRMDLLLVHLLRLVCSSEGTLSAALPQLSSDLRNLGVLSEGFEDLIDAPTSVFTKAFTHTFGSELVSLQCPQFWKPEYYLGGESSSKPKSRYMNDFQEIHALGRGGFGHVLLCKNKLDGRQYAVKRIRLKDKTPHVNEKILREVATLSRLQHKHVVRYYQAWVESGHGSNPVPTVGSSMSLGGTSYSYDDISSDTAGANNKESTFLYIQMEYCPRTLRHDLELNNLSVEVNYTWHIFRQLVEGLAHIHSQGIIHRDLNPNNIFFDVRSDIKIGDFGLAKFLTLEQMENDQYVPTDALVASMEGTGQVGTYFYTAPEIEQRRPQINEKVDMYSLGIIFFELWHPFGTGMERHVVLSDLKQNGVPPASWTEKYPKQSALLKRLIASSPSDRPSAIEILQNELPPRLEDEWLNDVLRMIQTSEDTYVYERVVSTIFDEDRLIAKSNRQPSGGTKLMGNDYVLSSADHVTESQDSVIDVTKEVFGQHCAKRFVVPPLHFLDSGYTDKRWKTVKVLTQGGDLMELCYELRTPFVLSVADKQLSSVKRYEISRVYRRAVGHSAPGCFLQGDFDIVGGASPITEAEVMKVMVDVITRFFPSNTIDIRLNHVLLLESVWDWVGIPGEHRQKVAELLSIIGPFSPHSTRRKSNWKFIRKELLQSLHLSEAVVDRFQKADLRFCGPVDRALARLRGTLASSDDESAVEALEDLSSLQSYLRFWSIDEHVSLDVLMPPSEVHYRHLFFQVYLTENNVAVSTDPTLLAVGGRYDYLVQQLWDKAHKSNPPGAVGVSIALEKITVESSVARQSRMEPNFTVLVCSKGSGGLLKERMELVAELWHANIKAEFVPQLDPSIKEQFEYATEHDIKCLVYIIETGISQAEVVKVRHLEIKKEKEVKRADVVKFLNDAISLQFRNPTIWN